MRNYLPGFFAASALIIISGFASHLYAQPEVMAWGNITGIRIDGQLMPFETSLCIAGNNWSATRHTAKERQNPRFIRDGEKRIITTRIDSIYFEEIITDTGNGSALANVKFTSKADTGISGIFFCIDIPLDAFPRAKVRILDAAGKSVADAVAGQVTGDMHKEGYEVSIISAKRQIEISIDKTSEIWIREMQTSSANNFRIFLSIHQGPVKTGESGQVNFTIRTSGKIDKTPVKITLDTSKSGRPFAGLGGNFRLQNPTTDPPVIDYCLENLRVAWGRVEMPWFFWQQEEDVDPIEAAKQGNLHERVKAAMEMAQRLHKMGMPVILSDWSPPRWAVEDEFGFRRRPGQPRGNPLKKDKTEKIYKSITDYILYLKENYGVEAVMFSFNESDIGINVLQTGEEHRQLIKGLGAYFKSKGLKTKLLLGDTGDANGHPFITEAMADPETHPYIGAVSFHAWRGWATETLKKWENAATKLNIPLLVGEGSIDAAAWRYPDIFGEETYARQEINLYVRILSICQPLSILQWQLTADYSPLEGGGIFGNDREPLHPTQRFWNLKQLAGTPAGLFAMPLQCSNPEISCAALGDNQKGEYAIHLVNNGSARTVNLSGLPAGITKMKIYITDQERGMAENEVRVRKGKLKFTIDAQSFITLMTQ